MIQTNRKKKRETEIKLIINYIKEFIKSNVEFSNKHPQILEVGSGDGFQIGCLKELGNVIGSDIYLSNEIKKQSTKSVFVVCDILRLSFRENEFDIIFSNHVIEHIIELEKAFNEMVNAGKKHCLYAFAVPTNVWLFLSIPAQFCGKMMRLFREIGGLLCHGNKKQRDNEGGRNSSSNIKVKEQIKEMILPHGHGVRRKFYDSLKFFKIESWQELFESNGFKVIEKHPLLLYAPSECPIIPMTTALNRRNICSSVLFLMQK